MPAEPLESISLWTCLHDGTIGALRSDLFARTLTLIVDSPFHSEFHNLPADTRIRLVGEGVRSVARFDHEPWPGAIDLPSDAPWSEVQEQQQRNWKQGRLISADWMSFAAQIGTNEEFIILEAEFAKEHSISVLRLGMQRYPTSQWNDIEVRADQIRFFVGEREFSADEFVTFGDEYWNRLSQEAAKRRESSGEA